MSKNNYSFYVGYLPLPAQLRPVVIAIIAVGLVSLILLASVLASRQGSPGPGEWDTARTFAIEGYLSVKPYPVLYVNDPESKMGVRGVLLVSIAKFGATERAAGLHGKHVRAEGQFITLGGRAMFELVDGEDAFSIVDEPSSPPAVESLGEFTMTGEIIDSKCFLGVMKPGFGKTHRACAVRCISGGIPPIFVTRDDAGAATVYLLTDSEYGAINQAVLPYVAEAVEVTGTLERHGDLLVYAIDAAGIVRK